MIITQAQHALITTWFQERLPRGGTGHYQSTQIATKEALFCAQIYKRGLKKITDENSVTLDLTNPALVTASTFVPPTRLLSADAVYQFLQQQQNDSVPCFFIVDAQFAHHWPTVTQSMGSCFHLYSPSESQKTLEGIQDLYAAIGNSGAKKIVGIGGGITLDVSGFLAGIFKLPVTYIATTFLACVDASIGGKTGVNFSPFGKNQLGLFVPTQELLIGYEFLSTLADSEIYNGLAECAKHCYLIGKWDEQSPLLEHVLEHGNKSAPQVLKSLIQLNTAFKSQIVTSDPLEHDQRRALNLGHTLGHVLEGLSEARCLPPLSHGVAVAAGMKALGEAGMLKDAPEEWKYFINKLLMRAGVTFPIKEASPQTLTIAKELLAADKKNTSNQDGAHFVLPCYGEMQMLQPHLKSLSVWIDWQTVTNELLPFLIDLQSEKLFAKKVFFSLIVCMVSLSISGCGFKADPQPLLPSPPQRILSHDKPQNPTTPPKPTPH